MPEYRPWVSKLLKHGQNTMVSEEFAWLLVGNWFSYWNVTSKSYYVQRNARGTTEKLHRVIMAAKVGRPLLRSELVDHINHDTTDNRDENLRLATSSENNANRKGLDKNNTSGYRGVSWYKSKQKWGAHASINGKQYHLGYHKTPELAAQVFITFATANMPGYINRG